MDELLRKYVESGHPEAFRSVVDQHVNAVYSQCMRQLRDPHLAEDATQAVFIVLARKAGSLPPNTVLGGWLFKAARYACANTQRSASRRRIHEQRAAAMRPESTESEPIFADIEPHLDDALASLNEKDRNAVMLRFFEDRSMREVGESMGVSEDAAKQRVCRAVDRLRGFFSAKGTTVSASTLGLWLGTSALHEAPTHLAAKAAGAVAAAAGGVAIATEASSIADYTLKALWLAKAKAVAAVVAVVAATGVAGTVAVQQIRTPEVPKPAEPAAVMVAAAPEASVPPVLPVAPASPLVNAVPAEDAAASERKAVVQVLRDYLDADIAGDVEKLRSVGWDEDPRTQAMFRELAATEIATRRMNAAWRERFGQPVDLGQINMNLFPKLEGSFDKLYERILARPDLADTVVLAPDYQTAMVPVGLDPNEIHDDPTWPPRAWASANIHFVKRDGRWLLDLSRTVALSVTIKVADRELTQDETDALYIEAMKIVASGAHKIADGLENDLYATPGDARNAMMQHFMVFMQQSKIQQMSSWAMPK